MGITSVAALPMMTSLSFRPTKRASMGPFFTAHSTRSSRVCGTSLTSCTRAAEGNRLPSGMLKHPWNVTMPERRLLATPGTFVHSTVYSRGLKASVRRASSIASSSLYTFIE